MPVAGCCNDCRLVMHVERDKKKQHQTEKPEQQNQIKYLKICVNALLTELCRRIPLSLGNNHYQPHTTATTAAATTPTCYYHHPLLLPPATTTTCYYYHHPLLPATTYLVYCITNPATFLCR